MTHRRALLLVVGAALAFFLPLALRGEVILSDDVARTATLAAPAEGPSARPFRDQSSAYVPELAHQLSTRRDGWLSTWNPHVELGRPAWQMSGLSVAFAPTHVLTWIVDDPYVLYTWLVVLAVLLSVVFGYLLLESLGLEPAACAFGALVLGLGFYVTFWLTYVLYIWGVCWTLALLWMAPRLLERPSFARATFVACATHALLLTAYPQQIVWHAYLLALVLAVTLARTRSWRAALVLGAATLVGVLSAAPVYLDLALAAARSARPEVDASFFAEALPVLERPADLAALAASVFDGYWFGSPLAKGAAPDVRGVSFTPVVCVLLPLALAGWRRAWPWAAFAALTVLFSALRPLHAFGVDYLGLSLSRHAPMAAAHVPAAVLAALAADRVLRGGLGRVRALVWAGSVIPAAALFAWFAGRELDGGAVVIGLALAAGALAFTVTRSRALLVALGLATVFAYGLRSMLARPLADTRVESELAEALRAATADGSRYVWIGAAHPGALHPNQETLFELRSVHSNNSLSSRAYHDWMRRVWSVRPLMEGRLFARLPAGTRPHPQALALAGISVLVSGAGELSDAPAPPLLQAQLLAFDESAPGRVSLSRGELRAQPAARVRALDDALAFELRPAQRETLLFLSQQYHPQWVASADGAPLETLVVNDFYQGVRVPPGVERVELRFRAWVRWSWVPQLAFALAALAALGLSARTRRGAGSASSAPGPRPSS